MMVKVLAAVLGPHNIRVNATLPGAILTPMSGTLIKPGSPERQYYGIADSVVAHRRATRNCQRRCVSPKRIGHKLRVRNAYQGHESSQLTGGLSLGLTQI